MRSKMEMFQNILENLFDIIIKSVQIGFDYFVAGLSSVSVIWKDDHLTPPSEEDDVLMWNGGGGKREREKFDNTPNDNIIYDGIMGDVKDDNG